MSASSTAFAAARRSALTLHERLAVTVGTSIDTTTRRDAGGDSLERWRRTFDRDGSEKFDRRLRWDGLEEHDVCAALRVAPEPASVPDWASLLEESCDAAGSGVDQSDPAIDPADPIPFEEVLLPFVQVARCRLRGAAPCIDEVLAPAARISLERALLSELSQAAEQALLVDFSVTRACGGGWGFTLGAPARTAYLTFVHALRAARLAPLIDRYPVLARILAVRAALWASSSASFVSRVAADAPAISALFEAGELGLVVELGTGRGDTHCGGHTVATVTFASGLVVMYKPRSMKLDLAFYGLLDWLRDRGCGPAHRVLRILDRGEHGWVEYVRPAAVESEAELCEYYERAGALVCLSYVLGAGDLHAENLIAAGPHPMLVDLEMMMCAPVQGAKHSAPSAPQPALTVLRSLLLPFWNIGANGQMFFLAGGLGMEHESFRSSEQVWSHVNTDRMAREKRALNFKAPTNVPRLDGRLVPPTERTEDIVRGFNRCHEFLERHRAELAAPGGALGAFRGRRVRVLIRDTRVYGAALRRSLHPRFLHDGFERSLQLEILRVSALGTDECLPHWRAYEAEQRDLEDLDYPFFWALTDDTTLHDSRGNAVGTFCSVSPHDQVIDRLARLDASDREHQESLIRFIYACAVGPVATVGDSAATAASVSSAAAAGTEIDASTALAEARAIADALHALVVRDRDGSAQWVGVDREQSQASLVLHRLRDRFHDGRVGIALFLSALDAVGATGHVDLAAEALQPLRRALRDARSRAGLTSGIGIGAGFGVGGFIYSLGQIGRLTNDASWIDDARHAARAVTLERVRADTVLDVLGGAAGALMALLSLHEMTGDRWMLGRAEACGRHLLDSVTEEPVTRRRVWRLNAGEFGTGFAHGAGGIATALLRLATVTGNDEFAAAAGEGFQFEDMILDPALPPASHLAAAIAKGSAASHWSRTWCNGPVGVALGRAIYGATPSGRVVAQASDLQITTSPDHPCCGTLGRAELLLVAGRADRARAIVGNVVARARRDGSYNISRDVPDARTAPAFFQGLSGIGYQLLRITHPERLRSALAFQ